MKGSIFVNAGDSQAEIKVECEEKDIQTLYEFIQHVSEKSAQMGREGIKHVFGSFDTGPWISITPDDAHHFDFEFDDE